MGMTMSVKRTKLDPNIFEQQLQDELMFAMNEIGPILDAVIKENVGTQYYSLADLKKMGHPYSIAHPHPPMNPAIINFQTGEFYESTKRMPPVKEGSIIKTYIVCESWKTDMLTTGTDRMMLRPWMTWLQWNLSRVVRSYFGVAMSAKYKVKVVA